MTSLLVVALVSLMLLWVGLGFRMVKQTEAMVIERLGRFHRVLTSGVTVIIPGIDQARSLVWRYMKTDVDGQTVIITTETTRLDLRETVYDFPSQSVITKDNVTISINALLYFQVTDPKRAVYEIANLPDAVEKLTQTTLRNVIGELDLDQTLSSRDTINTRLRTILDDATDKWGVKVNRVELQDIEPPQDVKITMEKQMRAERERRAAILEAEGRKQAAILEAEGERQAEINRAEGARSALILRAEGDAQARRTTADAEADAILRITDSVTASGANPTAYIISMRYIDTLTKMVAGEDTRVVYMPYEASALMGSVGGLRDLLSGGTPPAGPA